MIEATRFGRLLPQGGCIGVPALASPWENRSDLLRGVEWWQARGYRVKLADGIEARDSYAGLATFYGPHPDDHGLDPGQRPHPGAAAGAAGRRRGRPGAGRPDDPYVRPLRGGRAAGPLAGGDLWLLAQTMGTPWELELDGAILFFGEVDAPPWYVDGMDADARTLTVDRPALRPVAG